jgi:hypothetical protein
MLRPGDLPGLEPTRNPFGAEPETSRSRPGTLSGRSDPESTRSRPDCLVLFATTFNKLLPTS